MTAAAADGHRDGKDNDCTSREETVEEFKNVMYKMQDVRRKLVQSLLLNGKAAEDQVSSVRETLALLKDARTSEDYQRRMTSSSSSRSFSINIKDEIVGLIKDMEFLEHLGSSEENRTVEELLEKAGLPLILAQYHPVSTEKFFEELENTTEFLDRLLRESGDVLPAFITDWDGTMKNYCSQYATNLQPVYSALGMCHFAASLTRISAVLTAGPLRGPGILDLTALPIDGPVFFSGSWGREWWMNGHRKVHEDGISDEGIDALQRLNDEMVTLLDNSEFSVFGLVGSGVQRKVDRLTLGVQTVCGQVSQELSARYQEAVLERMHRVDPYHQILVFEQGTELEVEVCLHSSGSIWNKADGVARLMETTGRALEPGRVLIAGDTSSDLPMLSHAMQQNPTGTMTIFVGCTPSVEKRVAELVGDPSRYCFISCPDVFHAALSRLLVHRSRPQPDFAHQECD